MISFQLVPQDKHSLDHEPVVLHNRGHNMWIKKKNRSITIVSGLMTLNYFKIKALFWEG